MTEVNWTKLYSLHKGKWVTLKDDEKTVIVSGLHARTVLEKAQKAGYKNPI